MHIHTPSALVNPGWATTGDETVRKDRGDVVAGPRASFSSLLQTLVTVTETPEQLKEGRVYFSSRFPERGLSR